MLGEYDYDSRGRRTRSRGSSRGDVEYYYDGITVVEERLTGDGSLLGHYRYGDRLMAMDAPGGREWYHQDSQRTTGTMTDATGSVVSTYRLNPWGEVRGQTGSSTNRQIFTGHQHDTETGLIYMGARYYDPETGRFLTQDAVPGDPQNPPSLNRYLYVYGNPLAYADPDGNFPVFSHISDALSSFRSWQDGMAQQMQRDVDNGDANHVVAGGLAVLSGVANGIAGIAQGVVGVADAAMDLASIAPLAAVDAVAGTDLMAGAMQRTRERFDTASTVHNTVSTYTSENSIGQMAIDLDDAGRRYGRAMASGDLAAISGTASAVTELAAGGSGTVRGAQRALSAVARGADALGDGARVARQLGVRGSMAAAAEGGVQAIRGAAQRVATTSARLTSEARNGARRMSDAASEFGHRYTDARRRMERRFDGMSVNYTGAPGLTDPLEAAFEAARGMGGRSRWGGRFASRRSAFDDLARFRQELDGAPARSGPNDGVLTRLDIEGQDAIYGINAHGQRTTVTRHRFSRTHAEADAFEQAAQRGGTEGRRARLYIDAPSRIGDEVCFNCGYEVPNMARRLGLSELEIHTTTSVSILRFE